MWIHAMARRMPLAVLLAVLAAALWASHHYQLAERIDLESMRALIEAHEPYGPLVFIAVCIAGIFLHLPEIILIAIGGVLFEGPLAFAYGWVASLFGSTATFLIVRYFARDAFRRALDSRFQRLRALDERLARNGFRTVLLLRLVLFMAPPLNWALGATRVRLHHYLAGTALGVVPGIATAVVFAESIVSGPDGTGPRLLLPLLLVIGLVVAAGAAGRRLLVRPEGVRRV
jgi:uncharacterized membrane protein YdjX (TVP38/TMEM64 family)